LQRKVSTRPISCSLSSVLPCLNLPALLLNDDQKTHSPLPPLPPSLPLAAWVKLLQRAQYSRDVVDGKAQPNAEIAIMTKKELKRVVNANKTVKAAGFKSE